MPYSYRRLSREAAECRFTYIEPVIALSSSEHNKDEPPISMRIETMSLCDPPQFTALSYEWGPESDAAHITIDGYPMSIRSNLHNCLMQLRRRGVTSWLWIDSICINQADIAEKNWHVQMIGNVFALAEQTIFWLGPEETRLDAASNLVMDLVNRVGPHALQVGALQLWDTSFDENESRLQKFLKTHPQILDIADVRDFSDQVLKIRSRNGTIDDLASLLVSLVFDPALRAETVQSTRHGRTFTSRGTVAVVSAIQFILQRPLWNRCWIIQELGCAHKGTMMCGSRMASLDKFDAALTAVMHAKASRVLRNLPGYDDYAPFLGSFMYERIPALRVRRIRRRLLRTRGDTSGQQKPDLDNESPKNNTAEDSSIENSPLPTLARLLMCSGLPTSPQGAHYASTDPRDIVFALLPVISDADALGVVPDYTKSTAEVFTEATRGMLATASREPVASSVRIEWAPGTNKPSKKSQAIDGLPSWAPNWKTVGIRGLPASTTIEHSRPGWFNASQGLPLPTAEEWAIPLSRPLRDASLPTPYPKFTLRRHGLLVDTITAAMPQVTITDSSGTTTDVPFSWAKDDWIDRILKFASASCHTSESRPGESHIWHTLTMGSYPYMGRPSQRTHSHHGIGSESQMSSETVVDGTARPSQAIEDPVSVEEEDSKDHEEIGILFQRAVRGRKVPANELSERQARYLLERWVPLLKNSEDRPRMYDLQTVVDEFCRRVPDYVTSTFTGRTLFMTKKMLLGLGRGEVQEGDDVVVLTGSPAPIVLRPKDAQPGEDELHPTMGRYDEDKWEVIGDTYIDGIMFGEALSEWKLELRTFDVI